MHGCYIELLKLPILRSRIRFTEYHNHIQSKQLRKAIILEIALVGWLVAELHVHIPKNVYVPAAIISDRMGKPRYSRQICTEL